MARRISSVGNSSSISNMEIGFKFGAINCDEKYSKNMDKFTRADLSSNIILEKLIVARKRKKRRRENIFLLELCKCMLMMSYQFNYEQQLCPY
jgi:hypothetical protein